MSIYLYNLMCFNHTSYDLAPNMKKSQHKSTSVTPNFHTYYHIPQN